jgi:hypothetical protein
MKINTIIYKKLLAQAEEAKEQGLITLSENILNSIGSYPDEEKEEYTYSKMKNDIHQDLWKMATRIIHYYDIQSVDAVKLNEELTEACNSMIEGLEGTLKVNSIIKGPSEPKLPGEND